MPAFYQNSILRKFLGFMNQSDSIQFFAMGLDKKKLLLITAQYPYGKGEDFLQTEMVYLSAHFDEIYIMPRLICEKAKSKDMPSNVKVSTILSESCEKPI